MDAVHRVEWWVPGRLIYIGIYGDIRGERIHSVYEQLKPALVEAEPVYYGIVDARGVTDFSKNVFESSSVLRARPKPYATHSAIIVPNPMLRYIADFAFRVVGQDIRPVQDAQAAVALLHEMNASLPAVLEQAAALDRKIEALHNPPP